MTSLSYDAIENMSGGGSSSDYPDVPTGYDESAYFTISSLSDAHTFSERFNRGNGYSDSTTGTTLALGNRININDGTYNTQWMIAGFDVEYNRTASDGITYNNGYGIALIPVTYVTTGMWDNTSRQMGSYSYYQYGVAPYSTSKIDTSLTNNIVPKLYTILQDHLINRNVLLGSSVDPDIRYKNGSTSYIVTPITTGYTWTTRYTTLMSTMQLSGTDQTNNTTTSNSRYYETGSSATSSISCVGNQYDQGEANYRLPIFNDSSKLSNGYNYWLRTRIGARGIRDSMANSLITIVSASGNTFTYTNATAQYYARPMIYFR